MLIGCSSSPVSPHSRRKNAGAWTRLSEIDDSEEKTYEEKAAWKKYQADQEGITQEGVTPTNYEGFIDGEGFDGGDGQVGVVGSEENNLDKFDGDGQQGNVVKRMSANTRVKGESLGGAESKARQRNAFGKTTGYAEKLKEQGMVEYNEYGEDMLAARRQQLENWANQARSRRSRTRGCKSSRTSR